MKNNTKIYMFCNSNKIDFFKQELEKYFKIKNIIVWVKNNWTAGDLQAQLENNTSLSYLQIRGENFLTVKE